MGLLKQVKSTQAPDGTSTILYAGANIDMYVADEQLREEISFIVYENEEDEPLFVYETNLEQLLHDYLKDNTTPKMTSLAKAEMLAKLSHLKYVIEQMEDNINARPNWEAEQLESWFHTPQAQKNLEESLKKANLALDEIQANHPVE